MEEHNLGTLRRGEIIGGILYLPMFLIGSQILAVWLAMALGADLDSDDAAAQVNLIFGLINIAALGLIFFRYLRDQLRLLYGRGWQLFADTFSGLLRYFCFSVAVTWLALRLAAFLGVEYSNANQEAVEQALKAVPWMGILAVVLLAPPVEELLCRGLIFCGLYPRGRVLAYVVSMLVFAAFHVYAAVPYQPIGVSLVSFLVYLPAGYVLCQVYERSGTIWTSIFLHMLINLTTLLLQGLMG